MTRARTHFQPWYHPFNDCRDRLRRSLSKGCIKILAIGILIQMPLADACSEWKVLQWQPFQPKANLMLQPRKGKAVKRPTVKRQAVRRKAAKRQATLPVQSVKVQKPFELTIEPVHLPDRIWPDVRSSYLSALAARRWSGYQRQAGIAVVLPPSALYDENTIISDISRDIMNRRDPLKNLADKSMEMSAETTALRNIRFSLFNRDMQYINKDIPERDRNRFTSWDIYQSSSSHGQSALEALGKVFEPKVELGIEF